MSAHNITVRGCPDLAVRGVSSALDEAATHPDAEAATRSLVVLVDAGAASPSPAHRRDLDRLSGTATAVLVVCGADDTDLASLGAWLLAGADAVLPFTCDEATLASAADALTSGNAALPAGRRAGLVRAARDAMERPGRAAARVERLSPRERRVLDGLVAGHTVRRMADDDVVSVSTIRSQLRSVLRKLDVTSAVGAVAVAHEAARTPIHPVPPDDPVPPTGPDAVHDPDSGADH